MFARKQNIQVRGESISRSWCGRTAVVACAGRSSSWLCRAMLSVNSSFIATYCCDLILWASLAPIGGSAEESTTAPSPGGFTMGSRAALSGVARLVVTAVLDTDLAADAAAVARLIAARPAENCGIPNRDSGGGMTPKGVAPAPAEGQPTKVGDRFIVGFTPAGTHARGEGCELARQLSRTGLVPQPSIPELAAARSTERGLFRPAAAGTAPALAGAAPQPSLASLLGPGWGAALGREPSEPELSFAMCMR